ncbi:MAG: KpsF/GutQ family sugar-phosphate isomerase [Acidobacteria bacterium]|nr:KpsF/GutQ family sugar-phosphate isomerase [Acidobacteriota bacterium]
MTLSIARQVLQTESEAIRRLVDLVGEDFERAVDVVASCNGRIVWSGMGKSGIICRKLAATMASTGTPALFLHPAEAIHGDLGMVKQEDVVVLVSNSGETEEILRLVEILKRLGVPLIAITSSPESALAGVADVHLDLGVRKEACPLNLAPTASTTATLALGDALAMSVSVKKGFREEDFARLHPGGKLGRRFLQVGELMHGGEQVPRVLPDTAMKDVIYEMSRKGLGVTTVQNREGKLLGVITDGDLRRLMEREENPLLLTARQVMHEGGFTIAPEELATTALRLLEERRITSLMVTDDKGRVQGVLHLHDLWGVGLF